MTLDKWDKRFFCIVANEVADWSKDPKEGHGCIVVSPDHRQFTLGFNGFPRGIADTDERLEDRSVKNKLTIHAELNALLNAVVDIKGWTLYVTKAPCLPCALAIINKGIGRVVCPPIEQTSSWAKTQWDARAVLIEAIIHTTYEELDDEI